MGPCPICEGALVWRHNGAWCDRCHRKVETCCEGVPQPLAAGAACRRPSGLGRAEIPDGN